MGADDPFTEDWRDRRAREAAPTVTVGNETRGPTFDRFTFANGEAFVHRAEVCGNGDACVVHNPTDHRLRALPMVLRSSTLVERLCFHGVGHPDPDSVAWFKANGADYMGVHGCDGCCTHRWLDGRNIECPECGSPMSWSAIVNRWSCSNFGGCEYAPG